MRTIINDIQSIKLRSQLRFIILKNRHPILSDHLDKGTL